MTDETTSRRFTGCRKVRLGDVDPDGRLRLDALTRYTQDVSDDDTVDAGLGDDPGWVVRRTEVAVASPARLAETITITTYCSGLGRRWAERRLEVRGSAGGHYDVTTLWICVDRETGRPQRLTDRFVAIYGPAADGRTVSARLQNPKAPPPGAGHTPWPLRLVDFDTLGHVNNAAYWAVVEQELADRPIEGPFQVLLEYQEGIDAGDEVVVAADAAADDEALAPGTRGLWWLVGDSVAASAVLTPDDPRDRAAP